MTKNSEADATASGLRTLGTTILSRFEGLVCPRILDPAERKRQARAIGGFVGAGLVAVLAAPFAGLAGYGLAATVMPMTVGGVSLGIAAWLGASGRLEGALSGATAVQSAFLGLAATATGGVSSPALWLLAIVPAEALLSGRRALCGLALGFACLVIGAAAFTQWLAAETAHPPTALAPMAALAILLHAATVAWRMHALHAGRRADDALKLAEARLVEERLSEAVLRFAPDGRLISASRAAEELLGLGRGDLDADQLFSRIHVVDRVPYLKAFGDLRAGAEPSTLEVRLQRAGPPPQPYADIHMRFLAVRGPAGRLVSTLVAVRDVTLERRRTSELGTALDEARKVSDAKTQFLAAVSHELRTPLNAIIGFSDVLDQEFFGGFENPRQKEYVGLIRQSGEHLLSVVNGLLDVSKIEAGRYDLHLEPFPVAVSLVAAAETLRSEAERKGLVLDVRDGCEGAHIVADKRAIHQILLNLLSNAVKFTDRGVVTLEAQIESGMLVACVRDTGIGIKRQEIARLGQPFTQVSGATARQYQGTGLGLSLVKGLTELHDGTMEIDSEYGRGTRVTVRIPLHGAAPDEDALIKNETIVALTHARKKTGSVPHTQEDRRTA